MGASSHLGTSCTFGNLSLHNPDAPSNDDAVAEYYVGKKPRAFYNALHIGKGGGGSCFLNAALQALFAPEQLKARLRALPSDRSDTVQECIAQTFRLCYEGQMTAALYPNLIAERFYHGNQEDAAEFLTKLLVNDLASLQHLFQTPKRALLCCQEAACLFERPVQGELQRPVSHYLSLLRPDGTLIDSVQEALSHYPYDEDISHEFVWRCERCGSVQPPRKRYVIDACPPLLLLFLDRWMDEEISGQRRRRRNLLHAVEASREVDFHGSHYDLQSVVIHAGPSPNHGHYVAIAKHATANGDWWFYDDAIRRVATDAQISTVGQRMLAGDMQSYALFYSKRQHA
jgi:hypothetical protein